jgi:hypothetical protein
MRFFSTRGLFLGFMPLILIPWAISFLILNLANTQDGGPNATSRIIAMRAMAEEATFRIDKRIGASTDWAKNERGEYYSNKAPGPMLLGLPTFFLMDQIPRLWEGGYRDEHGHRHSPGYFSKTTLSFVNQILPLLFLLSVILRWLTQRGASFGAQVFFLGAALWGTTASHYFNNYSGHGFSAILQLALLFSILSRSYIWTGFFAGSALLSDFGFVTQIPAFLAALVVMEWKQKNFLHQGKQIALGSLLPAFLWIWYHTSAFGSPFLVANHFQNPIFLDTAHEEMNFLGIFRLPRVDVLYQLLFGPSRGLLFTQPWLLFLFIGGILALVVKPFLPKKDAGAASVDPSSLAAGLYCVGGLMGLLFMNASYGAWEGGGASGPRYLAGIFLCFGLWGALLFDGLAKGARWLLVGSLGVAIVFRGLVYGTTILGPGFPHSLWHWYIFEEFAKPSKTAEVRFILYTLLLSASFWWSRRLVLQRENTRS